MVPLLIHRRRTVGSLSPAAVAAAAFLLAASPAAAQPAPAPSSASSGGAASAPANGTGVVLVERADEKMLLVVEPLKDGSLGLVLSSQAPRCRFPESVFELPIQVNQTGFQLKHAIRPEQKQEADGSCTEGVATVYRPEHYWPLKTATAVTLHLPSGPLPLNDAALAHLRLVTPSRPAETLPSDRDQYLTAINKLTSMVAAGQARQAREAAEVLLPGFVNRPPDEAFGFFATLGMARRMTGDLAFAATTFEVATMLAAMNTRPPNVGVVYDNLATVRRLQKRWPEAEQASDRAIAALETVDDPRARQALAEVYNNRALMLVEQEQYDSALAYSEKALAILTITLKKQPKQLAPFLEDNRRIREKLGR